MTTANPTGEERHSDDRQIWDLWFDFTVGASGAVTALGRSREILDIAKTANAGEYLVTLRGTWCSYRGSRIEAILAAASDCHVSDLTNLFSTTAPSFLFVTQVESSGTFTTGNLTNGTKVFGSVTLCNSPRGLR